MHALERRRGVELLPVTWTTFRLFLHVMAATIWVGGQITLATLVPGARAIDPSLPRTLARRFNNLAAWPAFGVLIITGLWNIAATSRFHTGHAAWWITLFIKLLVVAASGISAFAHMRARGTVALAVFGSLTGISAIAAVFFGIVLHG